MRTGRAVRAALLALAVAISPGVAQMTTSSRGLERAPLIEVGQLASSVGTVAAPVEVRPAPEPEIAVDPPAEVAIVPPTAELTGPVAPPGPPPATFEPASAPPTGEVVALVVGIDDYPGDDADLNAAVDDADTIDAALAGFGVPSGSRVVLRDGQATRDQLVAALASLVARSGPGSTLVFAFAGHVQKLDHDTEALVAADGGLVTDQELAGLLAPTAAARTWLLLATCYAGGFTEALAPGGILTGAAGADELAYESPALNASFLVHHLVREGWLERRAGPSVQEAFAYADATLQRTRPERRPVQVDHLGEPLVLGGYGSGASASPDGGAQGTSGGTGGAGHPSSPPPGREPDDESSSCLLVLRCRRG